MIPWERLAVAKIPDSDGELRLNRRGAEYSIMTGGIELMNSRMSGSEKALATLSIERLGGRPTPRLLIGGLGMGFTLRAALEVLPADAQVVVAEIVPAVVEWARGPMAELFAGCLDDPRVTIHVGDVGALIRASQSAFDAILLDVDNGPDGIDRSENDGLYTHGGLAAARAALRPGGVLSVWSSAPDDFFVRRLKLSGYAVTEEKVHAHRKGKGARHIIWLATPS
jgi:spermidine synthase